uniref:Uncharacterized protein n=1 Tax=Tanacetum cinerariifolium TaxID=118510 RepID=A0A699HBN6_TANCI|nr:hypothetical protein [Tanacetum cinerariifolium]
MDIQFSNLEELQENQEEHICYDYWENCFSILNAKEAGNTKSPLSTDTFGNNGVDESETSGPETPAKEIVDNEKVQKRGLIAVAEDETTHFLEPRYSPSSILVPVLLLIEEYEIPESISLQDNTLRAMWL